GSPATASGKASLIIDGGAGTLVNFGTLSIERGGAPSGNTRTINATLENNKVVTIDPNQATTPGLGLNLVGGANADHLNNPGGSIQIGSSLTITGRSFTNAKDAEIVGSGQLNRRGVQTWTNNGKVKVTQITPTGTTRPGGDPPDEPVEYA